MRLAGCELFSFDEPSELQGDLQGHELERVRGQPRATRLADGVDPARRRQRLVLHRPQAARWPARLLACRG